MSGRRPRLRLAWALLRKAVAEAFRWGDRGAAGTALQGVWAALTAPYGQFPGER